MSFATGEKAIDSLTLLSDLVVIVRNQWWLLRAKGAATSRIPHMAVINTPYHLVKSKQP